MAMQFRRVVTGLDDDGKAVVISDGPTPQVVERPSGSGIRQHNMWRTDRAPTALDGPPEALTEAYSLHPPANGTMFRIVEFHPEDPDKLASVDSRAAFGELGAAHSVVEGARHPFMHATDTVDYAIILSGEITMLLDEEDVHLKAGDVVIQRGTNHAWSNRSAEPCVIAFILVDGEWSEGS